MNRRLTLLVATTALAAAGLPAWSALFAPRSAPPVAALSDAGPEAAPLILADSDDHNDDRDDDDDDDDDCDDDDDDCGGRVRGPAPAGTVTPPPSGLFGTGTPPQVKVN